VSSPERNEMAMVLPGPSKSARKDAKIGEVPRKEHDEVDNKGGNHKSKMRRRGAGREQQNESKVSVERFVFLFHVA